jgi:TrmH family RNA methyltransferase
MLSKAKIKYIKSLQLKKHRDQEGLFTVEGEKSVMEFLHSELTVVAVYGTEEFIAKHLAFLEQRYVEFESIDEDQLISLGSYKSNGGAIAIIKKPTYQDWPSLDTQFTIALDTINDPGNLGTIIRIADWYGINHILVSENSVDVFNPKVVNSSKGSFTRVQVRQVDLINHLKEFKGPIYAAMLEGADVHKFTFASRGILLMGSESHGISKELLALKPEPVTIPKSGLAESLNVAVATAIICDNIFH